MALLALSPHWAAITALNDVCLEDYFDDGVLNVISTRSNIDYTHDLLNNEDELMDYVDIFDDEYIPLHLRSVLCVDDIELMAVKRTNAWPARTLAINNSFIWNHGARRVKTCARKSVLWRTQMIGTKYDANAKQPIQHAMDALFS
eukprot:727068_1